KMTKKYKFENFVLFDINNTLYKEMETNDAFIQKITIYEQMYRNMCNIKPSVLTVLFKRDFPMKDSKSISIQKDSMQFLYDYLNYECRYYDVYTYRLYLNDVNNV